MSIPFSITYDNALTASLSTPYVQKTLKGQLLPDGTARVRLDGYVTRRFSRIDEVLAPFLIHGNCSLVWHRSSLVEDGDEMASQVVTMTAEEFEAFWQWILNDGGELCQK